MGSAVVRVGLTSHVSHVGNLGWPRCSLLPGFNVCRRRRRQTTMPQCARRDGLRAYPTSLRIVKVTSTRALMFPWWSPTLPTRTDSQPALCVALATVAQPSVMHFPHQRPPHRRRRRRRNLRALLSSSLTTQFPFRLHRQPPVRQRPRLILQHTSSLPMLATPVL